MLRSGSYSLILDTTVEASEVNEGCTFLEFLNSKSPMYALPLPLLCALRAVIGTEDAFITGPQPLCQQSVVCYCVELKIDGRAEAGVNA